MTAPVGHGERIPRNPFGRFAPSGDFLVDGKYLFEVGGRKKSFEQIKDVADSYLAVDPRKTILWAKGLGDAVMELPILRYTACRSSLVQQSICPSLSFGVPA